MRTAAVGLLVLIFGTASLAWGRTVGDPLGRQVSEIFVGTDDIVEGVPELIAQLEISAGIELGRIGDPQWPSPPPGQKYMDWMPIPPPRGMAPFEFRQGTVKEALDAFCRLNPSLTWSQGQGGVVNLVRRSEGGEALRQLLDVRIARFSVRNELPASAADTLMEAMRVAETAVRLGRWNLIVGVGRGNDVFPPRCGMNAPVSLDRDNVTLRVLLDGLVGQMQDGLWLAFDDQRGTAAGEKRSFGRTVVLTNGSSERRKLDLKTLVQCLAVKYQPLHGYLDSNVRTEDAKRELRRRYHFHPDLVRQALIEARAIQSMLEPNAFMGDDRLQWLFLLEDAQLTKLAIELALQMKDKDARHRMVRLFPDPCSKGFESDYLPVWQRLLSDSDPRVRQSAETILEWYRERQGRLRRQPSS
jgi:hypothetical protein